MITVTSRTNLFINNQTPTTNIYTLSLHDALPISSGVQWRSRSHRENRADQPVGSAANGDRNHGAGSAVSAIAGGGQRTELRRKRDGGFLGPSRAEPKRAERALLEHGGAASRPRNAAARAAGVDPAGRQRSAGGEGL